MNDVYVLDACSIIAFLAEESGAEKVKELFYQSAENKIELIMNKINLLEVYYDIYKVGQSIVTKAKLVTSDHHEFSILENNKELEIYWIR